MVLIIWYMDMGKHMLKLRSRVVVSSILALGILSLTLYIHDCFLYNPLNEEDYDKLFVNYDKIKKLRTFDLIGPDIHGDVCDISLYKVLNPRFNETFPEAYFEHDDFSRISNWKACGTLPKEEVIEFLTSVRRHKHIRNEFIRLMRVPENYFCYYQKGSKECFCFVYDFKSAKMYYYRCKS